MNDRLKSFLIEIECPSGAKLVGDLSRVAHAIALEFRSPAAIKRWAPPGIEIPEDIYAHICENEGRALNYIFGMPWEALLRVTTLHSTRADAQDGAAWAKMQVDAMSGELGPNPFLARVHPKHEEPAAQPQEIFQDIKGIAQTALDRLREGNTEGAVNLLASLVLACEGVKAPEGDGWGHAHEATTVEALLREGDAMLKGTDKHEQMFKDMDDKVKIEALTKLVQSLAEPRTAQIKAAQGRDKLIANLAAEVQTLRGELQQVIQSLQKVHRRLKTDFLTEAYGGNPTANLLRRSHEIQKLVRFAKEIEANPILRSIFSV